MAGNADNNWSETIVGEFTLEDTYDHLKELEKELHEQMEELINICTNNQVETISADSTLENIQLKQDKMVQGLLNSSYDYDSRIRPIAHTIDLYKLTNWELEQEVSNIQDVINNFTENITTSKSNIAYLENQISALETMTEVCSDATENVANTTYDAEMKAIKAMFNSVKEDLATVVEMILPKHLEFKDLLVDLTKAHAKGGDDAYIDVDPDFLDCIEFLVEADIVTYHRNDKNKIRLVDIV